ncbi:MAG: dihydrofolate reductase family protein [Hyphomicrobium sp.]
MTARLTFGMLVSADGYIAGPNDDPPTVWTNSADLHQYFNDQWRTLTMSLYGRRMYEMMHYWDDNDPSWSPVEKQAGDIYKTIPKTVFSTALAEAPGHKTRLVTTDAIAEVARLKAELDGDIEVAGPTLAASLTAAGLIDEYLLYFCPMVLGGGKPFFATGARLDLKLVGSEQLPGDTILIRYAPA